MEILDAFDETNAIHHHDKREVSPDTENFEEEDDEIQGIWQNMWQTMVSGAKQIAKKVAERFGQDGEPEQQEAPEV
jgi:hypothetical protein